jgi:hypothetical protein
VDPKKKFRASSASAAQPAQFSMEEYLQYCKGTNDEVPFYLFDRDFASTKVVHSDINVSSDGNEGVSTRCLGDDYSLPCYFDPVVRKEMDLFRVLGPDRPDFKWMVVGPRRSASIFHIDPNQTHAWNAVIRGENVINTHLICLYSASFPM